MFEEWILIGSNYFNMYTDDIEIKKYVQRSNKKIQDHNAKRKKKYPDFSDAHLCIEQILWLDEVIKGNIKSFEYTKSKAKKELKKEEQLLLKYLRKGYKLSDDEIIKLKVIL